MSAPLRGLIIAAPASGAGKTTVTLGLLRALQRRGTRVQPFKCGPDYIDTAFHVAAAGRPGINLDTWAMRRDLVAHLLHAVSSGIDMAIVEGVMGLYDGAGARGACGDGSTADLATLTGWPVILVLDVRAQAETAAAVALGLKTYRGDVPIAGVILNNVGGAAHAEMIRAPMARIGLPVLGWLRRRADVTLPERHLGLVQSREVSKLGKRLDALADLVEEGVDLDSVLALAEATKLAQPLEVEGLEPPGQRIALAEDPAFSFVYPHILSAWRREGAEIVPFSPLAGEAPPSDCDAVWLPGGYPELHAEALANARAFRVGMYKAVERGAAIHGECGGYMVLGTGLTDAKGVRHEMLSLLGVETSFAKPQMHLGYRRARLRILGRELLGHEFHFASLVRSHDNPFADICDAAGNPVPERGSRRGNVTGTFFHVIDGKP